MLLGQSFLDICNSPTRIQSFGTHLGAVHDGVAPVYFKRIIDLLQPLLGKLIPRILNPTISLYTTKHKKTYIHTKTNTNNNIIPVCNASYLHENCWAQVGICIPPVGRTGGGAACAEDALIHPIQLLPVLLGLQVLPAPGGQVVVIGRAGGGVDLIQVMRGSSVYVLIHMDNT